jgi:hypothetical protein
MEGIIPNPLPSFSVSIYPDKEAPDNIGISVNVEVSHNAAANKTASAEDNSAETKNSVVEEPVSCASLLVTEAMILAGEAIGRWKSTLDDVGVEKVDGSGGFENNIRLPFRTQRKPGMFLNHDDSVDLKLIDCPLSLLLWFL